MHTHMSHDKPYPLVHLFDHDLGQWPASKFVHHLQRFTMHTIMTPGAHAHEQHTLMHASTHTCTGRHHGTGQQHTTHTHTYASTRTHTLAHTHTYASIRTCTGLDHGIGHWLAHPRTDHHLASSRYPALPAFLPAFQKETSGFIF